MSMRPGEKVLAGPEELGLDSRTAFRRAATELNEELRFLLVLTKLDDLFELESSPS